MRKITLLLFTIVLFSSSVFAEQPQLQQKYTLERLILPNFVYSPCHKFPPDRSLLIFFIDERFYNSTGSNIAPTSCKGGSACWSWKIIQPYESLWDIQIFSSELPLKINNLSKLSESIASTIKETQSLRKSSNSLVSAAQEFVNSSFGAGKEKAVTKERSMTQSESRERATELNITPQFHTFLSKAVMGPFVATYPFCVASAVDLFYKAYYSDRSDDLVQAFVIYKNVKPEDIDFSNQSIFLNRAKFLHSLLKQVTDDNDKPRQDAAWAQAVLFAKLLEWKEFEEVRKFVDEQIQKAYQNYQAMSSKTAAELAKTDKNLAVVKYHTDSNMKLQNADSNEIKQRQNEIRDKYIKNSIFSLIVKPDENEIKEFEQALAKNDPLVTKKFVQSMSVVVFPKWFVAVGVVAVAVVAVTVIVIKKRKRGGKQ